MDFDGKTILVTGGTGSIGREIVSQLLKKRVKKVIVLSRDEIKQYAIKQRINDDRLESFVGDIRDYRRVESVFNNNIIDFVFHAAAMKHLMVCEEAPMESAGTNIIGTHNLIDLCLKHKVKKTIMISTDKAANPSSVMGASKFIAERITLNANKISDDMKFCCVRFGNVANARGSIIPIMIGRIKNDQNIWITDPQVTRFVMKIPDAVRLVLKAVEITQGGEIFILKMKAFRLGDLADIMRNRIAGVLGKVIDVQTIGLVHGEKMHEELLNVLEYGRVLENEELYIVVDHAQKEYEGFKKSDIKNYTSQYSEKLSSQEIEEIIMEYTYDEAMGK
ncbi:MAG: hypothetical protein RL557_731 [archaeon]|jgi:FlaA1/EpsC-like NDP-sugar epimerase